MADAPTGRRPAPPHRRTYTLRDLPLDVLSLILSFIPDFEQRFEHPRWACRELAAASVPPSVAWTDVSLSKILPPHLSSENDELPPHFLPAIKRAATAVRTAHGLFAPDLTSPDHPPTALDAVLTAIVPYLEELRGSGALGDGIMDQDECFRIADGLAPRLSAATRLTRLWLHDLRVDGPPGMIASGGGVFQEVWRALGRAVPTPDSEARPIYIFEGNPIPALTLHRGLTAAAAAARRPVQLTGLNDAKLIRTVDGEPPVENALAEMGAGSLTSLKVAFDFDAARFYDWQARVVNIVDALPHLRELHVTKDYIETDVFVTFDLRGMRRAPPYLSKLTFKQAGFAQWEVALPPVIAGRLASLTVSGVPPSGPPTCLADPTCAFTRLTRLAYGSSRNAPSLNLAPWSDPRFHLPNLVEMEVAAVTVTLDGGLVGQAWAVAVATETLPRLAVLRIVYREFLGYRSTYDLWKQQLASGAAADEWKQWLTAAMFVCRATVVKFSTEYRQNLYNSGAPRPRCAGCRATACAGAGAVADTVMRGLPAAAAEAGRRLVVLQDLWEPGERFCLLLKYESTPR